MSAEQVKAIIQLVASLAVSIAGIFGASMSDSTANIVAICVAVACVVAYAVWKNANFTEEASLGQRFTNAIKNGDISKESVMTILNELDETLDAKDVDDDD